MGYDPNQLKASFERYFGKGSYDSGVNQAAQAGRLKQQVSLAKSDYNKKITELKAAAKKATNNKTYEEAVSYWNTNKNSLKGTSAKKKANDIRNDPSQQESIKSQGYNVNDYINAMYNAESGGKVRSEREYNQLLKQRDAQSKKDHGMSYKDWTDLQKQKKKAEQQKKNEPSVASKIGSGIMKGLDIISRPSNAMLTGINEKLHGGSFLQGAEEGITGKKHTSGMDVNKSLGLDLNKHPFAKNAMNVLSAGIQNSNSVGRLVNAVQESNLHKPIIDKNGGEKALGSTTEFATDPLNLLFAAGPIAKGIKALKGVGEAAKGVEEAANTVPEARQLLLNAPQLQLDAPKPAPITSIEDILNIGKKPNGLQNPIPAMPDVMKYAAKGNEFKNAGLGFGYNTNLEPQARGLIPLIKTSRGDREAIQQQADNLFTNLSKLDNKPSNFFEKRLLDVQKQMAAINDSRGIYRKPLTIDELYQRAKQPGDPETFDKLVKMNELEVNANRNNPIQGPRESTLKDALDSDPRIKKAIQALYPKAKEQPISRPATINEMVQRMQELVPPKQAPKELDPLIFKTPISNGVIKADVSNSPLFLSPKSLSEENLLKTVKTNKTLDTMSKDELQTIFKYLESKKATLSTTNASKKQVDAIETDMKKVTDFLLKMDLQKFGKEKVSPAILDEPRQNSGNADTFRGKISETPAKSKNDVIGNLRTQLVDDAYPAYKYEKQITGNISSAENSLYKTMRTFKGSPEKAHIIVKQQLEPIFHEMEKQGIKLKDFRDYSLAIHARDVNAQGINSGMTNAEISDVIEKFGSPEMESLRQKLVGVNDFSMKLLSSGEHPVIDPKLVADLKKKWPNYMSLFRSMDDSKVEFSKGISNSLVNATNPLKKLEGLSAESNLKTIDPMESLVKNIFKAVNASDRNSVSSQVAKLAEKDVTGQIIRKLAPGENSSRLNTIHLMDKGEKVYYEVPPDLYKSLKNLDAETTNTLVKWFQKPAGMLRAGATLTPEFSLRNPMRDVAQAFVTSESGFNPFTDFAVGLWQSIWKGRKIKIGGKEFQTSGELYKQFIHENGGYGNIVSMDRNLHQKLLKEALNDHNLSFIDVSDKKTYTALLKKYGNPIKALRKISDVSETATKVGEFRAALRSGATPQEAAYRARDLMDFARSGSSVRNVNKVVAFLNANIQGKSKLLRALQANPVRFMGKAITAVTLPTIGAIVAQNTFANEKQKQIIGDAPQWLKDTFYLIPIPGSDQIARIPKPFDLSYPFSNVVERAFNFVEKHDKHAFDGFIRNSISSASIPVMLTGLSPFVEGMTNYSFFREGPIIPTREQGINYPDQYDINTSEIAKVLGKGINKMTGGTGPLKNFGSPRVIDNTVQGLTGGTGAYVSNAVDWFLNSTGLVNNPDRPSKTIDQKPLTRAFLVNQTSSGESLDKLYTLKDKLAREKGSAKEHNQPFMQLGQYNIANSATKSIGDISSQIRTVQNSPQLTSDQKKQLLDQLIQQRNMIAIQTMKRINQMDQ